MKINPIAAIARLFNPPPRHPIVHKQVMRSENTFPCPGCHGWGIIGGISPQRCPVCSGVRGIILQEDCGVKAVDILA